MKKKKSIIVLALFVILFFVLSFFFISHEINHDCNIIDCPICEQIVTCKKALEELDAGVTAIIVTVTLFDVLYKILFNNKVILIRESLISLKIKMLN